MANPLRVKCACGEVVNAMPGNLCPKCRRPLEFPADGLIMLYRMGSPLGIAGGFGIYLNNEPMGYIGNRELIRIPVKYGTYNMHIAVGMNRKCTDLVMHITPENRYAYAKVHMRPGFWSNHFIIEPARVEEMPLDR